uniref:VWFA domain-containing protein n=1 Tax=Echeneis naucrates TaxID=173247 RepID=A0A665WKR4_ECHNA
MTIHCGCIFFTTNCAVMKLLAALCVLLLQTGAHGFGLGNGKSLNHQEITERGILNTVVEVCRAVALAEDRYFLYPPKPFNAESVAAACGASKSLKTFSKAISYIQDENVEVDHYRFYSARHHFDNELILEGRKIVTEGLSAVKASNRENNFKAARKNLGKILHSLQDFYSHSNWVELGNKKPNPNLIRSGTRIGNLAAKTRATCRNCFTDICKDNILEDVLRENILTTGYFSFVPFASKPKGKCSHGGFIDFTSGVEPEGGINKDELDSSHGHLHFNASNVAIAATSQLLEDVRGAAGDRKFLQMMGIAKGKPLCFVVDTTGSMGDDIAAVKKVTASIIDKRVGTVDEPSLYILVPFGDPSFGPLTKTTDPKYFKRAINSLKASGGGDFPELSLTGLQLALTSAPPNSEIFVFTDAPAKDTHLRGTVLALIERTQSEVRFMITNILSRSQSDTDHQQQNGRMSRSGAQLYRELAQASGGQYIEVSKSNLLEATTIITESSTSFQATIVQAARSRGKAENVTFTVDESVRNLTIYITGHRVDFTLISPEGVTQNSTDMTGPLIISSQSVGNLHALKLKEEVGLWEIRMVSAQSYTLKVVGETSIDFLFDFMEVSQGPFGGFTVLENRPKAGVNGTLRVMLTGSDSAKLTEVSLVESSGLGRVHGIVTSLSERSFLVQFDKIPSAEFAVLIMGQNGTSSVSFQRQSSTSIRASSLTVTADNTNTVLAPGMPLSIPFSVATEGAGGVFRMRATNDRDFDLTFPSSLVLEDGGSANGTVNITSPSDTPSGTDVTLTIEANAPGGADTNYAVLSFTVLHEVTDFTPPVCELISLSNCTGNCSLSMWELSVQVTDGTNGTGIDRIELRQGDGTMNISVAAGNENMTLVSYNASCCSPAVELVVIDHVGNVGFCFYTVQQMTEWRTAPRPQNLSSKVSE